MGYDVAVIGGGVAGMSAAAFLSEHLRVVVVEAEAGLSYHASGRSAALYTECYGPGIVPTLTMASRSFLMDRDEPLGSPRGVLFVAEAARADRVRSLHAEVSATAARVETVGDDRCRELVPALDAGTTWHGLHEPGAMDLDIHALESAYRTMVRSNAGELMLNSRVHGLERSSGGPWAIRTTSGSLEADIVVNAAGAWGDAIAAMAGIDALGLRPLRRSAFLTGAPPGAASWPMTIDVDERWYCKPEGRNLLGSAADEVASDPIDARPEEVEIALAIERINAATNLEIRSVVSSWAGLRTFTPDRLPAVGPDPTDDTFVWVVGQGGYGIKTSPAIGELVTGLIVDRSVPRHLADRGVTQTELSPQRFR